MYSSKPFRVSIINELVIVECFGLPGSSSAALQQLATVRSTSSGDILSKKLITRNFIAAVDVETPEAPRQPKNASFGIVLITIIDTIIIVIISASLS